MTSNTLQIRPYARLLTMLGDQLIKNECIALVELLKNAYDADAENVEVHFQDFNPDMSPTATSRIVVKDDGTGMTFETIRTHWMNPAAPHKYLAKQYDSGRTAIKQRIIQGEKGIGRFAVLKLGRVVTVTTRPAGAPKETVLLYDFSDFDDDFVHYRGRRQDLFLDEININYSQVAPTRLSGVEHGTIIEIENLKGTWGSALIEQLRRDVSNLTDPVSRLAGRTPSDDFDVTITCNGTARPAESAYIEELRTLIDEKAVFRIEGEFDCTKRAFLFETNSAHEEIGLAQSKITGLWVWRRRFRTAASRAASQHAYLCGNFRFHFYIFDFSRGIGGRHGLNQAQKNLLKDHRIYLYRDDMRVYPYGDPDDDWLRIDVTRGTGRVGNFFSNDQVIGWIDITQRDNPALRDKTNREGLIETGGAAADLMFLIQTFLSYIKHNEYARYQIDQARRRTAHTVREGLVTRNLAELRQSLQKAGDEGHASAVATIQAEYVREKQYLLQRAEMTEDLAGVGLSVEMASHDIMLLLSRAQEISRRLARAACQSAGAEIQEPADLLVGVLQQVVDGMGDIQGLFRSSRRRRKVLRVEPILDKIYLIYKALLDRRGIRYRKVTAAGSPLTANTTAGVVMQVLINLFDNAAYWLETTDTLLTPEICVTVDGPLGKLIFSDNGPGVQPEDLPYVFEAFYSGKGQEGRGLGLYIAQQLLERHDYGIELTVGNDTVLPGANFVVNFRRDDT